MLVAELVIMPSDDTTLYCKDNGTIALAKEYQISKHIEQQNMRLPRIEIYKRYREQTPYVMWLTYW